MANYGKYYIAVRLLLLKQYLEANSETAFRDVPTCSFMFIFRFKIDRILLCKVKEKDAV